MILHAVGDDAFAPLKQQYIGFGDTTVLGMIDHLRLKTAIKITMLEHGLGTNPSQDITLTDGEKS